ncbi:putative methyltransferase [Sinorhizobium sojae CCBAU 05684]|uniref:Putative methyltransferase n=1 Tax=Sinorhizobium sojae CCBAU 05684 TaxID=716928 RepID=A0A249PA10_9HYPH|nr:class I SAM-dependent methyltransferase [Sinorhizobium sojae]ASY62751.1 putative methyltransferase [Sinorhizobium sojae CCBAU 05684]
MQSSEVGACWEANAENWTRFSRAGYDVYRDALNTPAFLDMLPPVAGLRGLDLGCGEGSNTRRLAEHGALMTAIDIAPTFIRHAQEQEEDDPRGIRYVLGDGADLPFEDGAFDFVTAFMSLMDMPDQPRVLWQVFRVLREGSFFQFSILHPCFVPPRRKTIRDEHGDCHAVEVADYFYETDGQIETWLFSSLPRRERENATPFRIPRFHRTLSSWMTMIIASGFVVEELREPMASEEAARLYPTVADTRVAPIFLHLRLRKPKS